MILFFLPQIHKF